MAGLRRRSSQSNSEDVENIRDTLRELGYPVQPDSDGAPSDEALYGGSDDAELQPKSPPSKLWAIGMCLVVAISAFAASAVLQGQQRPAAKVVKTNPSMEERHLQSSELILYKSLSDGISSTGTSLINGRSMADYCSSTPTSQFAGLGYDAVLQICTDPWMGGGLTTWKGGGNPDVTKFGFVTFLARAQYSSSCTPRFG